MKLPKHESAPSIIHSVLRGAAAQLAVAAATMFSRGRARSIGLGAAVVLFLSFVFPATPAFAIYVQYFQGQPQSIAPGQATLLRAHCQDQDGYKIYNASGGLLWAGGGEDVTVNTGALYSNTTYSLECHDNRVTNTVYAYAQTTITMTTPPPPAFTAPVWNSFTATSPINSGSSATLYWNVTPNSAGADALYMYGGQWGSGTRMAGWQNNITTYSLFTTTSYYMYIVDPSYGTFYSPPQNVTVITPPSGNILVCGPPSFTNCTSSVTINMGEQAYVGASYVAGGGSTLTASAIVQSTPATTNPDTYGSFVRCDARNGCDTASLGGYFTPSSPNTYYFYPTEADTAHAWSNYSNASVVVTVNAVDLCPGLTGNQTTYPSGSSPANSCTCPAGSAYDSGTNSCIATYDFSLFAPSASIMQGASGATTVSATRLAGSASTYIYAFSQTGLPSGVSGSFSPSSCTPTNSSCTTLNLTVGSSVTAGSYPVTIYAYDQSGTILRTTNFTLTVTSAPTFTFSLSSSPSSVSVVQGSSVQSTIGATLTGGSATPVNSFFATGNPSGMTVSFSPSSCTPTNASCTVATFATNSSVTPGTYTVYIYGTGGGNTMSTPVTVTVTAASVTPAVSIATSDDAGESGTGQGTGTFVLSRVGGGTAAILPVLYTISGTATYGTDYTLGGTCVSKKSTGASIPANASSCTVIIVPVEDSLQEGTETITLTLTLP